MAITINQNPYQFINLSGNPIIWTFSSTNTGQANFTFYIELYINGALDSTHEVIPESGTNGKFDGSIYAENNTEAPELGVDRAGVDSQSWCSVYLKVYEKYGATATVQAGSVQTSTTVYAIKGKKEINDWIEFLDVDDQYIFNITNPCDFLTETPIRKLREGETFYLSLMTDQDSPSYFTILDYLDEDGNVLDTQTDLSPSVGRLVNFALTYAETEADYAGLGTFADVHSIRFEVRTASGEQAGPFTVLMDRSCRRETTQVVFLSQLGNFDTFTFDRLSRTNIKTEAKSFITSQGEWDGTSYSFDGTNVNKQTYQTISEKEMILTSEWLTEQELTFLLNNLVISPYILLRLPTGLRRVANGSATFNFKKKPYDTLFNLEMRVDLGRHNSMII
jgi:hypothetical protein